MKLHPEDPRLTALLMGELSADEATAVRHAVAADPALGLALRELESMQEFLTDTLAPKNLSLLPRQRDAILQAARHADSSGKVIPLQSQRKSLKPLLIPLAAAAVILPLIFLLSQFPGEVQPTVADAPAPEPVPPAELPLEVALFPAPGPADAVTGATATARPTASAGLVRTSQARAAAMEENGDLFLRKVAERLAAAPPPQPEQLPLMRPRRPVIAADQPELQLPVHAGRASLDWVTRSIREDRKRPPVEAVRLEEILNHFTLRPAGPTAIARGVTLSTELIACPWRPSSLLLIVSFRGAANETRNISARLQANPAATQRYRLLGFANIPGLPPGPLPTRLPPANITSLAIEIEPSNPTEVLGTIHWTVDGEAAPPVPIQHQSDAEPSDDARFAALICTYAQWLTDELPGAIDTDLLAALARENVSDSLTADRTDFLNLIDQSLRY
jgi:hypothetical protein